MLAVQKLGKGRKDSIKPPVQSYRGILVYNICLISISNSVSDGARNSSEY